MLNESRPFRAPLAAKVVLAATAIGGVFLASACSSDTAPETTDGGTGNSTSSTGGKSGTGGSTSNGGSSSGGKSSSSGGQTSSGGDGGMCTGKPAAGTNDPDHCKSDAGSAIKQATGKCQKDADAAAPPAPESDAGGSDYGDTLYGTEGDDDDCKYHVKYTVPPICENDGVTFHATVTNTADGKPTTGAYPYLEATLDELPSASPVTQSYKETSPGVYDVGPIVFDRPGKWTVRFHFFEDCSDEPEDSPHGHVAFYIDVP